MADLKPTSDEAYLNTFLQRKEDARLEFKTAEASYDTSKAIRYSAAIANEGGGHFILGVTDALPRVVVGTNAIRSPQELEHRIWMALKIKVQIRELLYDGKRVVVFTIPQRMRGVPVEYDGRFPMRAGESLVSMSAHQIAEILAEHQGTFEQRVIVDGLSGQEIERLLDLDAFFDVMPDSDAGTLPLRLGRLVDRRLLTVDVSSGLYGIRNVGALFLARDLKDFPELLMRRVRVIRYSSAGRVHAVFEHFETRGYGVAFDRLIEIVASHVPVEEIIEGGRRVDVPSYAPRAIREFLANALIHQDLEEEGVQITIEIFPDRLEFRNPGKPLIPINRFVNESRTRNPDLAELMRLANICEVRGSGVDRAIEQIEDFAQPAPRFALETAATRVTLVKHLGFDDMTQEERVWAAFLHCCVRYENNLRLTNSSLRARHRLPTSKTPVVSQTIAAAVEAEMIKPDPRAGNSKRHAAYLPFFGQ